MYSIVETRAKHSSLPYTGIKCHDCHQISYCLDDIRAKRCRFCHTTHTSRHKTQAGQNSRYTLYWGTGKTSTKAHWSVNGVDSLCLLPVSLIAPGEVENDRVCGNCRQLKKRGFIR